MEIRVSCPICNGDGFVSFGDRHTETRPDACETCHGEGTVPARTGEVPEASASPTGEGYAADVTDVTDEVFADVMGGLDEIQRINDAYHQWLDSPTGQQCGGDPWAAFQWGYLTGKMAK